MPPKGFHYPKWAEKQYEEAIRKLLASVIPPKKPDQSFEEWLEQLKELSQTQEVRTLAEVLAKRMVQQINVLNAKTWREASARTQRSRMLFNALRNELAGEVGMTLRGLIDVNAKLIRSIPYDVAHMMNRSVATAQQEGLRPNAIGKMLRTKFPKFTGSKIRLIARTQTAAASTALTQARAQEIGLEWAVWETSEDQRTRPAHKFMQGVIFSWNDLPAPEKLKGIKSKLGKYAPGQCPNCRCYPAPMLSLDDVSWPHRVYHAGHITRMTRAQFQKLSGVQPRKKVA